MGKAYIDNLAYIHVVDGKVLMTLSRGKDVWYIPGGKRESDTQALFREAKEELNVDLIESTVTYYATFEAQAHGKPTGTVVRMTCYRLNTREFSRQPLKLRRSISIVTPKRG